MTIVLQEINGKETEYTSPEHQALSQFYKAFNTQDIKLMQENWSLENGIMDNPLGGILRGWENISEVYKKIFFGGAEVYVEFYDYTIQVKGDMFFAAGRERGYIIKNTKKIELDIRTSRIFMKEQGVYKQAHHHGSITNPQLLDTYQKLIMS